MGRESSTLMPPQDLCVLLPSRWVLDTDMMPWIPSGTTGTGTRWLGWVSLLRTISRDLLSFLTHPFNIHSNANTSTINLGSLLYSKLINAELESHESKTNFYRFTLSQGDWVVEWERMVVAWEANHSKPDPYVVVKSGKCIFLHNFYRAD